MDGFEVKKKMIDAVKEADIVTASGCRDLITENHFPQHEKQQSFVTSVTFDVRSIWHG
jgi:adenosylhomocysteinase